MSRAVFLPGTLEALWDLHEQYPEAAVYAGGTDLLVRLRDGVMDPAALICLERIPELRGIADQNGSVRIGAGAAHETLLESAVLSREFPVLCQAVKMLGSPPIRHMGTIGGNIVTASPAGDTLAPLYLLEAEVELGSAGGRRRMKLAEFITGPGKTRLERHEIVTAVIIPKITLFGIQHYEKVGLRNALACAVASLAALLSVSDAGMIRKVRLAWGSVGPTVMRSPEVEVALAGKPLNRETLEQAAAIACKTVAPIDDIRATAAYRRRVAGNLLLRLLLYRPGEAP